MGTSSLARLPRGQQLTDWELTKFDSVPGIAVVYRHGPISIYDLKGIGVQELRSGWYGETPPVTLLTQLAVGLLGGLLVGLTLHSRLRPRLAAHGPPVVRSTPARP